MLADMDGYGDTHRRLLQLFVQHKTLPQVLLEKTYDTLVAKEGLEEAESTAVASVSPSFSESRQHSAALPRLSTTRCWFWKPSVPTADLSVASQNFVPRRPCRRPC